MYGDCQKRYLKTSCRSMKGNFLAEGIFSAKAAQFEILVFVVMVSVAFGY